MTDKSSTYLRDCCHDCSSCKGTQGGDRGKSITERAKPSGREEDTDEVTAVSDASRHVDAVSKDETNTAKDFGEE